MASAKFRQDMPPPGGYGPIEWAKKVPKRGFSGFQLFGGFIGVSAIGWTIYYFELKRLTRERVEMGDARIALDPFLTAEQDRSFLKQLRKNRNEEAELMKDVPGWEVGKIDGEPVFHNLADRFHVVSPVEYFAHTKSSKAIRRLTDKVYH